MLSEEKVRKLRDDLYSIYENLVCEIQNLELDGNDQNKDEIEEKNNELQIIGEKVFVLDLVLGEKSF